MDQLNRGIKVEGLMLPPGITLTRVNPATVEANRARMEAIARVRFFDGSKGFNFTNISSSLQISQPMQPVPPEQTSHLYMPNSMGSTNPMMVPMNMPGQDPNGFVMIDPMNTQFPKQQLLTNAATAKLKKKKRKSRNKKGDEPTEDLSNSQLPKLVTLRNPLFHANNEVLRQPMPGIARPATQLPVQIDQPAAIIKNDNGMFTIRNPALHQAISNGVLSSGVPANRSYGPDHNYIVPESAPKEDPFFNRSSVQTSDGSVCPPKHTVAIGSEVKHAQQKKQQQKKQQQMFWPGNNAGPRNANIGTTSVSPVFNNINSLQNQPGQAFTPYDNQAPYGFNGMFGASPVAVPVTTSAQSNFYNGNGLGGFSNGVTNDYGYLFGNTQHRCDDSPPLSSTNNYYEGLAQNYSNKYDDMTFLYNLQPGQRLNNEVID